MPTVLELRMWRNKDDWKSFSDLVATPELGTLIDKHEYNCLMKEIHGDLIAMLESLKLPSFTSDATRMKDMVIRLRGLMMQAAQYEPYNEWVESRLNSTEENDLEPLEDLKPTLPAAQNLLRKHRG